MLLFKMLYSSILHIHYDYNHLETYLLSLNQLNHHLTDSYPCSSLQSSLFRSILLWQMNLVSLVSIIIMKIIQKGVEMLFLVNFIKQMNKQQNQFDSLIKIMQSNTRNIKFQTFFEKRRYLALEERRLNRQAIFERSRKIFMPEQDQSSENQHQFFEEETSKTQQNTLMMDQEKSSKQQVCVKLPMKKNKQKSKKNIFAKKFQVSDWLYTIPKDFGQFFITARPQGQRCLIFFKSNMAVIRDKHGNAVKQIKLKNKNYQNTILESYFKIDEKVIYLSDLISWKGTLMTGNQFCFRYAWLQSNIISKIMSENYQLKVIEYRQNNLRNLQYFYQQKLPYSKDGLIFVHPQSFYENGLNHNILVWKDSNISNYSLQIESQDKQIRAVGRLASNGNVYTLDGIKVAHIPNHLITKNKGYVTFQFTNLNIQQQEEQTVVNIGSIQILSINGYHRPYADPLSKLIYQYQAKHNPLVIKDIIEALTKLQIK